MVSVLIYEKNDQITGFKVTGHANFGPHGEDLVCAAVSVLTQSAIIGLHQYVGLTFKVEVESGKINCILPEEMEDLHKIQAQAILNTMVLGLETIKEDYSKHIRIEKRRWNP
jgi:uncharacterized protein